MPVIPDLSLSFEARGAAAALNALWAYSHQPPPEDGFRYLWLPRQRTLLREDVIAALGAEPKPISCVALRLGGLLGIGVWARPERARMDPASEQVELEATQFRRRWWADFTIRCGGLPLVVLGPEGPAYLSPDEYPLWQAAYDFPTLGHGVSRIGTSTALDYGAAATVTFSPMSPNVGILHMAP